MTGKRWWSWKRPAASRPPSQPDAWQTWLIRFKQSDLIAELVTASSAEIRGEHLVFLRADGKLAALAVLESVESCSEVEPPSHQASWEVVQSRIT